jgi:hypothetical protein
MKGILIDDDGDLMIRNGRLVIGDCEMDVVERVISAWPGEFKEAPVVGGGVRRLLNGGADPFWCGEVKRMLASQHVRAKRLEITPEGVEVRIMNYEL